jgi:uncharacterized protein
MKKNLIVAILSFMAISSILWAAGDEPLKHRIVVEVSHGGLEEWVAALNNVANLRDTLGTNTEIEVVAHNKGLGLVMSADDSLTPRMKKLADEGVVFAACEKTMKAQNVKKDQLVPFAKPVDSGVSEIVRKQELGWSYLKTGL